MKTLFLILLSFVSAYGVELIYISNNISKDNLERLEKKYKQKLLINDKRVYLIPSDCRLQRYFSGVSEADVKLIRRPKQTEEIVVTQDIFEAEDEKSIIEKIEVKKSIALLEGKVVKDFLDDKEGRGYAGVSEIPLDFTFQKEQAKQAYMKPQSKDVTPKKEAKQYKHPECELLEDGSGYRLLHTKNAYFYFKEEQIFISKNIILFD